MAIDNKIEISVREMVDETFQSNVSVHSKNRIIPPNDRNIDQALLSLLINTNATVSVADLPTSITDHLNVGAKRRFYENNIAEPDEEATDNENYVTERNEKEYQISSITRNNNQQKRHIMISYNRSSIKTCRKIYHRLVERDYKVWMDLEHMYDDILVAMARAVENSYIVLLCINQQYYESNYCRLEAEYALEKRIKFIPCLMEEEFHPKGWLGIIKGSNLHIDFSSPDNFDQSFEQLIRQINFIEQKLALQPRANDIDSIKITNQSPSDEEEEDNEQFLYEFIDRTLEQNELLLKLVDHLTRQRSIEQNRRHNFDVNSIIKTVLTIAILWSLIIYCQKL